MRKWSPFIDRNRIQCRLLHTIKNNLEDYPLLYHHFSLQYIHLLFQNHSDLSLFGIIQLKQIFLPSMSRKLFIFHWRFRDAAYGPIRELKMDEVKSLDPVELRKVDMNDFLESMKKMKKSVSPDSLLPFENWNNKFGEGSG